MSDIKKENLKNSLAYIPLLAFFFYFTEENASPEFKKHINYWMIIFGIYVFLSIVFSVVFLYFLVPILFVAYLVSSFYLGYRTFNWNDINIVLLDNIEWKIKGNSDKK